VLAEKIWGRREQHEATLITISQNTRKITLKHQVQEKLNTKGKRSVTQMEEIAVLRQKNVLLEKGKSA
jgi:hypothetical protein